MLQDITIENYRLYKKFHLEGMNRINLLIGANNCGKSSLLEAIYLLVNREDHSAIPDIINKRFYVHLYIQTRSDLLDLSGSQDILDIFHKHDQKHHISVTSKDNLNITIELQDKKASGIEKNIKIKYGKDKENVYVLDLEDIEKLLVPWRRYRRQEKESKQNIHFITPYRLTQQQVADLWEQIVLTSKEETILDGLRILEPNLERIALLNSTSLELSVKLKLNNHSKPASLGSMGDGIYRILALIITLVNCENGVLLIDEIDTGLHYSALAKMWKLVIETARKLNVQVFATTHSWDALSAFHKAMSEAEALELGTVFRLERQRDQIKYVSYTGEELAVAVEHDIEVR